MIGYLRGVSRGGGIVDVGGVGYLVRTVQDLPAGDEVELHVHTQVREDAITLFGFAEDRERALFETLLRVNGVGAGTVLALLRSLGSSGLVDAIRRKDAKALAAVKGVGPKLADKIILLTSLPDTGAGDTRTGDVIAALTSLGWDRQAATGAATAAVASCGEEADDSALVAAAISFAGAGRL